MKCTWAWTLLLTIPVLASACGGGASERSDLPEDFPDDFPVYEGAHPTTEIDVVGNQIRVRFEVEAPRQEVTDFYERVLNEPPWRVTFASDVVFEEESFVSFRHDDNEVSGGVGTVINKETGKTNFVVAFTLGSMPAPTPTMEESPAPNGG